jgi:hypothetical protein
MQPISHVKKKLDQKKIAALLKPPPTVAELIAAIKDGVAIEWRKGLTEQTSFLDSGGIFRIYLPQEEGKPADPVPDLNVKDWKGALWFALLHLHLCRKTQHMFKVGSWIMDLCPISYDSLENLLKTLLTDMSPQSREKYFAAALEAEAAWLEKKAVQQVAPPEPNKLSPEEQLAQAITTVDLMQYARGFTALKLAWANTPLCCENTSLLLYVKRGSSREEIRKAIWSYIAHRYVLEFMRKLIPELQDKDLLKTLHREKTCLQAYHKEIEQLAALWQEKDPPILKRYTTRFSL